MIHPCRFGTPIITDGTVEPASHARFGSIRIQCHTNDHFTGTYFTMIKAVVRRKDKQCFIQNALAFKLIPDCLASRVDATDQSAIKENKSDTRYNAKLD